METTSTACSPYTTLAVPNNFLPDSALAATGFATTVPAARSVFKQVPKVLQINRENRKLVGTNGAKWNRDY
jgi:hypothetical protein